MPTIFARLRANNLVLTFGLVLIDQVLKYILKVFFPGHVTINSGIALGLGSSILTLIGLIGSLLAWQWQKGEERALLLAMGIAALSNVLDRLIVGGVIDYLYIGSL